MATYQSVAVLAQTTAMVIFGTVLAGALVYAFWPGNKARFERAANLPLETEDAPIANAQGDNNGK